MNVVDVAACNNLRILELLVAVPGTVCQEDLDNALMVCVKQGKSHIECMKTLLKNNASPNAVQKSGEFTLKIAAEKGFPEIIQILAEFGANLNLSCNGRGTALHFAASSNKSNSMKTLIELGADVNSLDNQGCTPLIICALSKNFTGMKELINAKCKLDISDNKGRTALHYACHKAMGVEILLTAGADPNIKDTDSNCPIHMAATEGFDNVIIKLLNHECNPDNLNCFNKCALHYLAMKNHWQAIEAIAEVGGTLELEDNEGNTPLFYAIQRNRPEAVKSLLMANCSLKVSESKVRNDQSSIPLYYALHKELFGIAKLLVLAGAELSPVYKWLQNIEYGKKQREQERQSRIFVDSDEEESEEENEELDEAVEWFGDWLHRPHTLQQICRMAIRFYIGPGMVKKQMRLPVPQAIRDYITLREVEDHHVEGYLI